MKKSITFSLLLLIGISGFSQHIKTFNVPGAYQLEASAARLLKKGYIITGRYNNGIENVNYISKYSTNGAVRWTKNITEESLAFVADIAENQAQELYLLAEDTYGDDHYSLIKTDSSGNELWTVNLSKKGFASYDMPRIKLTATGQVYVMSSTFEKTHLFHLNDAGSLLWSKTLEIDTVQTKNPAFDMQVTPDGGVMYAGKSANDIFLQKFSSTGAPVWTKRLFDNDESISHPKAITALQDGNYLIAGFRTQFVAPYASGMFLLKIDASGQVLDFNFYTDTLNQFTFVPNAVQETAEGKIRMMGCGGQLSFADFDENLNLEKYSWWSTVANCHVNTGCFDYRNNQLIVTGTDDSLQYVLRNNLENDDFCNLEEVTTYTMQKLAVDNGVYHTTAHITSGPFCSTVSTTLQDHAGFAFQTICGEPEMLMGTTTPATVNAIVNVYPNPVNGSGVLNINALVEGEATIRLTNAAGQMVYQQMLTGQQTGINLDGQPAGLYFLTLTVDEKTPFTTKIIVY